MNRPVGTARFLFGVALLALAISAVALAATSVARRDNIVGLADQALTYGSSESLLTAVALTHSRLSEALVATSGLSSGEVDRARLDNLGSAIEAVRERVGSFPVEDGDEVTPAVEAFLSAVTDVTDRLEKGAMPPVSRLTSVDDTYVEATLRIEAVRARAAEAVTAAARSEVGTFATAASVFVIVVVPVLAMTGVYRALRSRQQQRESEVSLAAEHRLREERNRLIQAVGYELKTPLTTVVGLSAALRDDEAPFHVERHEIVSTLAEQARELANRIDDLLIISRIDAGVLDLRPHRVEVRDLVERIEGELSRSQRERITVTGRGMVRTDPVYLTQVIRNLITCALRSGGKQVEIRIRPGSMMLNLEVRDDGTPAHEWQSSEELAVTGAPTVDFGGRMTAARRLTEHLGGTLGRFQAEDGNISLLRLPLAQV